MIAACYTADLYCDIPGCATNRRGGHGLTPTQFTGRTWTDCARQAKRDGWLIGKDKNTTVCPKCKNAGWRLSDVPKKTA